MGLLLFAAAVTAANALSVARPAETVSAALSDLGVTADSSLRVTAPDGRSLSWQVLDGQLLFSSAFAPNETRRFTVVNDATLPAADLSKVCNAEVCPERAMDFVWENDKLGLRAYGPKDFHCWSGIDFFNKAALDENYCIPLMHRTLRVNGKPVNGHKNVLGKGMDNYTLGASRGIGAAALFGDGEWKTYPNWCASRVLAVGPVRCVFELDYPGFSDAGGMTYRITLDRGQRLFRNDVSFERAFPAAKFGPGLDVNPARNHKGSLVEDEAAALVSLFEDPLGKDGEEGSSMAALVGDPADRWTFATDNQGCRILIAVREGKGARRGYTCWAGGAWSLAGEITAPDAWHAYVRDFRAALTSPLKISIERNN